MHFKNFSYLYSFTSPEFSLIEVKRLDRGSDAPPSEVYFWLVIKDNQIQKLNFKSMKKSPQEFREFNEGELHFDDVSARFLFQGKEFILSKDDSPERFNELIERFFIV